MTQRETKAARQAVDVSPPPVGGAVARHAPLLTVEAQAACAAWDAQAQETWRLRPLRVTAHLGAAVVFARIEELSLDGLLASAALLHLLGGGYYELLAPDSGDTYVHVRLPLAVQGPACAAAEALPSGAALPVPHLDARHAESLGWWWWACASPVAVGPMAYDVQHFHKRFDTRADLSDHLRFAPGQRERLQVNGGPYKSWRRPVQANSVAALTWRCVGDAETVRMLLEREIPSVGKHRNQGYGMVMRWEVADDPDGDGSLWTPSGGFARPVPALAVGSLGSRSLKPDTWRAWREPPREEYVGYRAPRWMPEHQTVCLVGGER